MKKNKTQFKKLIGFITDLLPTTPLSQKNKTALIPVLIKRK